MAPSYYKPPDAFRVTSQEGQLFIRNIECCIWKSYKKDVRGLYPRDLVCHILGERQSYRMTIIGRCFSIAT